MGVISNIISSAIPIVIALIVFGILVLVHEFGHFIFAVKNGILVKEFAIGMGPLVYGKKKGDTLYSIRLLPIGGFCSMLGEDEDSLDERSFSNKSVLARISVVVAGAMFNLIFAFLITLFLTSLHGVRLPVISEFTEGGNAEAAGLQDGDRIVAVNGKSVHITDDISLILMDNRGEVIDVTVKRDTGRETFTFSPYFDEATQSYKVGFLATAKTGLFSETIEGYGEATVGETLSYSFWNMAYYVKATVTGFVRLITANISRDDIAGPIGIISIIGDSYESGLEYSFWTAVQNLLFMAALLSTNLGVLNLFPIPAMDGGRLVFLIVEGIRGKGIDPNKEGFVHLIGFAMLMLFMVVIAYNDIMKLIG